MPRIVDVTAEVIEVPLKHAFVTSKDSVARTVSRPVVIALHLDDGTSAVGEAVPVEYVTGESQESVMSAVARAGPALRGTETERLAPAIAILRDRFPLDHAARAGFEMAVYNAFAASSGLSLWYLFGAAVENVETDLTLSIAEGAVELAVQAYVTGFRRFKMKVGGPDRQEDLNRIMRVHNAVPEAVIRLDANQAFGSEEALRFIAAVVDAGVNLELVEQPVPKEDLAALDRVSAESPVPIFADEAVKTPADALRVVTETRVHGINVKLMKSGISGAFDIISIARAVNRKLMIGCMLETRRGISASVALACGTGAFDYVDLDSHMLLNEPGENPYFAQTGPVLSVGL